MASPSLALGLIAVMAAGAAAPTYASPRRTVYHVLNSTAFAAFAILGLDSLRLVLAAVAVGGLVQVVVGATSPSVARRRLLPENLGVTSALVRLGLAVVFLTLGLLAAWGVNLWLGAGGFPLPLTSLSDLLAFMACATTFACVLAALNEGFLARFSAPLPQAAAATRDWAFLPGDAPLYRLMLASGSSLQVLAQFLYLSFGELGLFMALGWFVMAIEVQARLLRERLRLNNAFRELEASQRALVVGELSGRIVHQTRHQLGLLRIGTHLIREGLAGAHADRAKILEQTARVDGVASALSRMLSEALEDRRPADEAELALPPAPPAASRLSLREVVHEEVERLQGKAEQLGIRLRLEPGPPGLLAHPPDDVEPLAQGVFNVVDNALAAARSQVRIRLEEADAGTRVVVEDDGPGMTHEMLQRAGEPFVTTKEDGTGVGLFVAAAAVKRWGGSLAFQNRREGGLEATFHLPRSGRETGGGAGR